MPALSTVAMLLSGYCSFPSGLCDGASGFSTSLYPGERAVDQFIAFWLRGGLAAGMNVSVWDMNDHAPGAGPLAPGVGVAALADPGTLLGALAGQPAAES